MTYKESYKLLNTAEEVLEEVKKDINGAIMMGSTDRVNRILKVASEVFNEDYQDISDEMILRLNSK